MSEKKDPYRNFRFLIEINGIVQAGFSEATIVDSTRNVIEYREGNEPTHARKLPGLTKHGILTLKRGIMNSLELDTWRKLEQEKMKDTRRNITLLLIDEKSNPVARWEFRDAWPSKYDAPDLTATGNDLAIETLDVAFETMERVQTGIKR
ncbi:MAG: phage tail protein [Candidatus Bathyarchaeum sp.]|nr:MAG: phage tail protein [Candidatus Bathyarchaeum sp.]